MERMFNKPRARAKKKRASYGFSLFEVLLSLLLVTSISLALLKQQWKSNAFFLNIIQDMDALLDDDNQHELNPTCINTSFLLQRFITHLPRTSHGM